MINRERDFLMWFSGYIRDKRSLSERQLGVVKELRQDVFDAINKDTQIEIELKRTQTK